MTWRDTRLDKVASVQARIGWKALTADEYVDDGYVFLSTPNIKTRDIDFENVNYITKQRFDESPELKLQPGDVLLAKDGSTLGICNVVRDLPRPATVNGSIAVLRPRSVNPVYLRYYLEGAAIRDQIALVKNGMGVPHLFQWDINRFPLTVPSLDMQRRIADFLDDQVARIDEIIRLREEQADGLARLGFGLHGEAVSGAILGRSDSGFHRVLGPIACGWPVAALKHVVRRVGVGLVINPSTYVAATGVPFLLGRNVRDGWFDLTNLNRMAEADSRRLKQSRLRAGDVVVVRAGYPGRAAVVPPELDGANCASILILREPHRVLPEYLEAFFNGPQGRAQVKLAQYGAAQEQINVGDVVNFQIPIPPLDEQREAVQLLAARTGQTDGAVSEIRVQIDLLQERKRSLITAAVTGEFDVTAASGRGVA